MYSHLLKSTIQYPDSITVHVCRADPGEGKTHMARQRMRDIATRKNHVTVGVYAAPTLRLILQTIDDLLTEQPKLRDKIHLVCSDTIENDELQTIISNSANQQALRSIIDRVPHGMPVTDQFEFLLTGSDDDIVGNHIDAVPVGHLIFVTHECVARLPETLRGRERCSLFFDEARQCLHANMSMNIPSEVIEYLIKDHGEHGPFIDTLSPASSKSYMLWRWNNATYRSKGRTNQTVPLTLDTIASQWPKGKGTRSLHDSAKRVLNLVNHIKSKMLDVYVATSEHGMKTSVNVLMAPNRLFYGWGTVLILAADFERSQMYHLLMSKQNDVRLRKHYRLNQPYRSTVQPYDRVSVIDVTESLLDKKRVAAMKKRKEKITVAYLMDYADDNEGAIGSAHVNMGLVFRDGDLAKLNASHDIRALYRDSLRALQTSGKLGSKYKPHDLIVDRVESEFQKVAVAHRVSKYTPIQKLALTAARVSEAWQKQNRMKVSPCLMAFNSSSRAKSEEGRDRRAVPQVKSNRLISLLNAGKKRAVFATPQCQGLNTYKHLHTAFYCAPLKLTPQQAKLFEDEIHNYNTRMDRTADMLKQFAFRINMREANSTDATLVIVPDRATALYLNQNFLGSLAKVVPATEILDYEPFLVVGFDLTDPAKVQAKSAKQRSSKRYQEYQQEYQKEYRSTNTSKEYRRLSTSISRVKKKIKTGTADTNDQQKLVILQQQLAAEKVNMKRTAL